MNPLVIRRSNPLTIYQGIYGDVALWAKLNHQNILWCFGVTVDRLQIVMDWMPNGEVMKYVQEHKPADRVCLVKFLFLLSKSES